MKSKPTEIAEILLELEAVKLSPTKPFTWASGIKSPIYCDNRITLSHPEERTFISRQLLKLAGDAEETDIIAGVATSGIPYASIMAHLSEKPLVYVRSVSKGHGRRNAIEGEYSAGQKVLLVEDLISTGGSALEAAEKLREAGLEVVKVVAVFSYELAEAEAAFTEAGIPLATLSNYSALLQQALTMNYIKESELEVLQEWNRSPKTWNNG